MSEPMDNAATALARYQVFEQGLLSLIPAKGFSSAANMRLERIAHLVQLLGNPQRTFPAIHVTGTAGKGSTSALIAAILTAAGCKTGLFLSPPLQLVNECYQIDGRMVATSRLAAVYAALQPALQQVAAENPYGRPSSFEAQVALAFCLFQQEQVDAAVIEVGLGGSTDATNVLDGRVAVLTNVGLDHTEILGGTLEAIAREKAGIIKPGQIVVSGLTQPATRQIVAARCAEQGATIWQAGQAFTHHMDAQSGALAVAVGNEVYSGLRLRLQGHFQHRNAACAVAAVHAFTGGVTVAAARAGVAAAVLPGRMERVQEQPTVILDGAHNRDKLEATAAALATLAPRRRRIVVVAFKADKPYEELLEYVVADAALLIVTAFHAKEGWQPIAPEMLAAAAAALAPELEIRVESEPLAALHQALAAAGADDLIWVTGSLYLVGNVREHWYPAAELLVAAEQGVAGRH